MDVTSDLGQLAAAYAERGFHVFPCRPGDKRPAIAEWQRRATTDVPHILRAWPSPRHNIGIACGLSGLVVIDLDMPKPGKPMPPEWVDKGGVNDGADVFAYLSEQTGVLQWPATYTAMTPSKGTHFYYQAPEGRKIRNSAGKIGPMVDVRAGWNADGIKGGGYVIAAGSVTVDNPPHTIAGTYVDLGPADVEPLPAWLADLTDPPRAERDAFTAPGRPVVEVPLRSRLHGLLDSVLHAQAGERNNVLHWAACRAAEMVRAGECEEPTAVEALTGAAVANGLTEREARRTIASALTSAGRGAA